MNFKVKYKSFIKGARIVKRSKALRWLNDFLTRKWFESRRRFIIFLSIQDWREEEIKFSGEECGAQNYEKKQV
jgi:hypothetical protein